MDSASAGTSGGSSSGGGGNNHDFEPGDFVWGKYKDHPWWPGQVHNANNASEEALKQSHDDHLLVVFFDDQRSFSWCLPSELMPFVQNFDDIFGTTSDVRFLDAVQIVLDEIGRVVEADSTCKCIPLENRGHLARSMVNSSGVNPLTIMPEIDIDALPVLEMRPAKMLARLTELARGFSEKRVVESVILRSRISAYNLSQFGCRGSVYRKFVIEGLESNDESDVDEGKDGEKTPRKSSFKTPPMKIASSEVETGSSSSEMGRKRKRRKTVTFSIDSDTSGSQSREKKKIKTKRRSLSYLEYSVYVDVKEMRQNLEFAAVLDDIHLRKGGFIDSISSFMSAHRSSTYVNGSDYEIYQLSLPSESSPMFLGTSPMSIDPDNETGPYRFSIVPLETSSTPTPRTGPPQPSVKTIEIGTSSTNPADAHVTNANKIMRKLELVSVVLQGFGSRFSGFQHTYVEHELKGLLANVEKLSDKVIKFTE